MKNSKKILIIITCLYLIFTIVSIVQTYAKYVTSVTGTTNIPIARWNIIVNSVSIKNGTDLSSSIFPKFQGNANIAENVLAPSAEGFFDLAFEFSEVDVSFNYTISILPSSTSAVSDLIVTGYSVDGGTTEEFTGSDTTITDHISYTDDILAGKTSRTITVFVLWNDDPDTSTMDNAADTNVTLNSANKGLLDVKVSFTQTV